VAGYLVFGIGGALWVLFLGRIIDGLTSGNISTLLAYVADITPPQERGRTYGLLGAASGFGFIIGPAIGGLAGHYSLALPAFVAALVTFGNILWAFFALPETRVSHGQPARFAWRQLNPLAPFAHVYRTSTLVIALGAVFFYACGASMWQSNVSVFLKDVLAFGPGGIGVILLVVGVMDIFSQGVLAGRLLPRFGERALASAGLAINAAGILSIAFVAFVPSNVLLGAAVVGITLGDGFVQPSLSGIIANAAPADVQGQVQGANQGQQAIARIVGPLLAAFLYTVTWSGPYVVGAAIVLVALAILFRLPRRVEHVALV
jgi:DHA1 family tetracycline resistance protein-like MFS transporter